MEFRKEIVYTYFTCSKGQLVELFVKLLTTKKKKTNYYRDKSCIILKLENGISNKNLTVEYGASHSRFSTTF